MSNNKPVVFKPHDGGMEYVGSFPEHFKHSWVVEYKGYSVFLPVKPTRKQIRAMVDWVNLWEKS